MLIGIKPLEEGTRVETHINIPMVIRDNGCQETAFTVVVVLNSFSNGVDLDGVFVQGVC